MIALVDYGAGNLTSVRKALAAVGADVATPSTPDALASAAGVIVPGVGHFDATRGLTAEWTRAVRAALDRGVPLLGICVGLQWLFEGSSEAPGVPGLGVIAGTCERIAPSPPVMPAFASLVSRFPTPDSRLPTPGVLKIPHVGWNSLSLTRPSRLLDGVADQTQVYFTHSYAVPIVEATVASTTHGTTFSAAVEQGLVSGVQFHPEKSGEAGLRILTNWIDAV